MFLLQEPLFQQVGKDKGAWVRLLFRKTSLQFSICSVFHRFESLTVIMVAFNLIENFLLSTFLELISKTLYVF